MTATIELSSTGIEQAPEFVRELMENTPRGVKIAVRKITPSLAKEWLERMVPNRKVNMRRVGFFAEQMKTGQWKLNFQPILRSRTDETLDGQHRLMACVEADIPFTALVITGLDPRIMDTVDTGKSRTFADMLQIEQRKHSPTLSGAVKLIWHYEHGTMTTAGALVSHQDMHKTLDEHEFVSEAVDLIKKSPTMNPASPLAAVYTLTHERKPRKADAFFKGLVFGEGLFKGEPPFELRERINKQKNERRYLAVELAALTVKAWNAYYRGDSITPHQLKWRNGNDRQEVFPEIEA